jgi:hypothetical protein
VKLLPYLRERVRHAVTEVVLGHVQPAWVEQVVAFEHRSSRTMAWGFGASGLAAR